MPYTFNGSYPSEPEDKRGWVYVSAPPLVPEGKELAWLNWTWVVRDPIPTADTGNVYKWNYDSMAWVQYIDTNDSNNTNMRFSDDNNL